MGISAKDRQYMRRALDLAAQARGRTSPNPMVGVLVVRGDEVVGQGYHKRAGRPHAEVEALRAAGERARGATLYTNLEPCCHRGKTLPCVEAILKAGIVRVVTAMVDPDPRVSGNGIEHLHRAGVEVDCGVLEGEARRLNEAFVTFHLKQRPFVIAKWAMTLDGRTSTPTGDSRWISNDASREYAHEIRASVDAIAVGVGTIFLDNPRLNVRLDDYHRKQPARVIFDGSLRLPFGARCLDSTGGETFILTTAHAPQDRVEAMRKAGNTVIVSPGRGRIVAVADALKMLAQHGIQSLLVEGGRSLHTSLLQDGLVDKVVVFIAPKIIGGESSQVPVLDLGIMKIRNAIRLKNVRCHSFGTDACVEGYINLPTSSKSHKP